jgi:twitching motility protein PilT
VSALDRFLELLERPGVVELVLCTGAAAAVRVGDTLRPITQRPLRVADIVSIVAGSAVEELIRTQTGDIDQQVDIATKPLRVRVSRTPGGLEVILSLATRNAPEPPPPRVPVATDRGVTRVDEEAAPVTHEAERRWEASESRGSLAAIVAEARREGVSDVHFVSDEPVRWRKVGRLVAQGAPMPHEALAEGLRQFLTPPRQAQLEERGYVDFSAQDSSCGRLRINVCRQRTGLKACMRLIAAAPPTLTELGLPPELGKVQHYHQGLIVISGPNGHGKTTTLAALVDLYNQSRPAHIITVEDPVEFIHPPKRCVVSQREVGVHTRTFQTALKGALREDPDIIAIGELRDRETVEMALTASETGHVVLATMSTPNGASTIERLIDMFAPEDQSQVRATLAGALKLVISQRLIPTLDGSRLVAAAELITGNVPLWTLIRDNKLYQLPSLLQRGRAYGMIRVEDSLNDLLERGIIDEPTARAHADEPKNIGGTLKQAPPATAPNPAGNPGMLGMFRKKG